MVPISIEFQSSLNLLRNDTTFFTERTGEQAAKWRTDQATNR